MSIESIFGNNTFAIARTTSNKDDESHAIRKGLLIFCAGTVITTLPISLLGVAMLIESIVRFPISLVKEYFASKGDGVVQARERFKTSSLMIVPFINFFNFLWYCAFKGDFITDPDLKAMYNDIRFRGSAECASGILSQQFYLARPIEWAMGIYDPKKLDALMNEFKSPSTLHPITAEV